MRRQVFSGGGEDSKEKERAKGKLSARERVDLLLDPGTFEELYPFAQSICTDFGMENKRYWGDGIITGLGRIDGRKVCAAAMDVPFWVARVPLLHLRKWCKIIDFAARTGTPFIQLNDSSGGRVQEGNRYISYCGSVFNSHTQASGVVPQITAIVGRNAGHGVYGAALTDFVFIVDDIGEMYITGLAILKAVAFEEISFKDLGWGESTYASYWCCGPDESQPKNRMHETNTTADQFHSAKLEGKTPKTGM